MEEIKDAHKRWEEAGPVAPEDLAQEATALGAAALDPVDHTE